MHKLVNGEKVELAEEDLKQRSLDEAYWQKEKRLIYKTKRLHAYPSLGDQLDMLWHAMDEGILPKVHEFYKELNRVKKTYPKEL